jgi:hypothetical protein
MEGGSAVRGSVQLNGNEYELSAVEAKFSGVQSTVEVQMPLLIVSILMQKKK